MNLSKRKCDVGERKADAVRAVHRAVDITPKSGWPQADIFGYWRDPVNVKKVGGVGMMSRGKLMLQYVMREIAELVRDEDGK